MGASTGFLLGASSWAEEHHTVQPGLAEAVGPVGLQYMKPFSLTSFEIEFLSEHFGFQGVLDSLYWTY